MSEHESAQWQALLDEPVPYSEEEGAQMARRRRHDVPSVASYSMPPALWSAAMAGLNLSGLSWR